MNAEAASQLVQVLEKTTSGDQNDMKAAQAFLESASQTNLPELIRTLSDVLYHGANSAVVRQQAGVQLKNFLHTNDESLRSQYEERWLAMPEEVRLYTKQNVLGTLGTESFRPSAAAQCVQLIAMVELPRGLWPGLLATLVQNVTNAASTEIMKESTLQAIGYICQDVEPRCMEETANEILTAIVHGMRRDETSNQVKLASTNALLNSLEFTRANFEKDAKSHFIMQLIQQLEGESLRLRGELSAEKHTREELRQRSSHTRKEVEVLGNQFIELQEEIEGLNGAPAVVTSQGKMIEEMTVAVRKMRLDSGAARVEAKKAWEELENKSRIEERNEIHSKEEMTEKIQLARLEVERKENLISRLKDQLFEVQEKVVLSKKDLNQKTTDLTKAEENKTSLTVSTSQIQTELIGESRRLAEKIGQMHKDKINMEEELENRREKFRVQEQELQQLGNDREKKMLEKSHLKDTVVLREKSCTKVRVQLEEVMGRSDGLERLVVEESKVEKDLEMLKEDFRVCEENRRMAESDVMAMNRVVHQKMGLEKENINMKSWAEMLLEKIESYKEDLTVSRSQMEEASIKEKESMSQVQELEKEELRLDEDMKDLSTFADKAVEEAEVSDAVNKELTNNISEISLVIQIKSKILTSLELKELELIENLKAGNVKIGQINDNVAKAENENAEKTRDLESVQGEVEVIKNKISMLESRMKENLMKVQNDEESLASMKKEEKSIKDELDSKKQEFKTVSEEGEKVAKDNEVQEKNKVTLSLEISKHCEALSVVKAELEEKKKHLVDADSEIAREMDKVTRKQKECMEELVGINKELMVSANEEEDFVKQLEAIDKTMKEQKRELAEKSRLADQVQKELNLIIKEAKLVEKDLNALTDEFINVEAGLEAQKQEVNAMKDALEENERKRLDMEEEVGRLEGKKIKDLGEFRTAMDRKVEKHAESIKALEGKKDDLTEALEVIDIQKGRLDLEKKTKMAKKKLDNFETNNEFEEKLQKLEEERISVDYKLVVTKKGLEAEDMMARRLQAHIDKAMKSGEDVMEVDSDEENMAVRKLSSRSPLRTPLRNRSLLSMPSSSSTKRKLQTSNGASVKTDLANIFKFGESSDSEGHSQPKFKPPSTPRGRSGFLSSITKSSKPAIPTAKRASQVPFTPRSAKPVSSTYPSPPSSLRTFLMPQARPARSTSWGDIKKKKANESKKEQVVVVNFDEVMAVSSDIDSC